MSERGASVTVSHLGIPQNAGLLMEFKASLKLQLEFSNRLAPLYFLTQPTKSRLCNCHKVFPFGISAGKT